MQCFCLCGHNTSMICPARQNFNDIKTRHVIVFFLLVTEQKQALPKMNRFLIPPKQKQGSKKNWNQYISLQMFTSNMPQLLNHFTSSKALPVWSCVSTSPPLRRQADPPTRTRRRLGVLEGKSWRGTMG